MSAVVLVISNPFIPQEGMLKLSIKSGKTIQQVVDDGQYDKVLPTLCFLNDEVMLREEWDAVIADGDIVTVAQLPLGVETIIGGFLASLTATQIIIGVAVAVGAALLLGGLLDIPGAPGQLGEIEGGSPTYNLGAQGNRARLGQSIPAIFGRHRVYPDFAEQPWQEYVDNDQYLNHLLVVGQGEYELLDVRVDDTLTSDYPEVIVEKLEPGEQVSMFRNNVHSTEEVAGQELFGLGGEDNVPLYEFGGIDDSLEDTTTTTTATTTKTFYDDAENPISVGHGNLEFLITVGFDSSQRRQERSSRYRGSGIEYYTSNYTAYLYGERVLTVEFRYDITDNSGNIISGVVTEDVTVEARALRTRKLVVRHRISDFNIPTEPNELHVRISGTMTARIKQAPDRTPSGVDVRLTAFEVGVNDYVGLFVLNPTGTEASSVAVDITLPRGLYKAKSNGDLAEQTATILTQVRSTDDSDNIVGEWQNLGTETIVDSTTTAIRRTFEYDLPEVGRYQIRMRRLEPKDRDYRSGNDVIWESARAFLTDRLEYQGLTMLAVRMRATNNLSNRSSRKLNALVQRKIPTWNPQTGWSNNVPTSSVSWALADIMRAEYGAELLDSQMDLQNLYELDQELSARGDEFNGVFDRKISAWEAIKSVARVGRAVGVLQNGVFRCIRDRRQSIEVASFSQRNIVKDSFSISYKLASEDTHDGVEIEYIDPETWRPDTVAVNAQGGTPNNPAMVRFFGCTNRSQAIREALYIARNNQFRRRTIKFTTELEGYIPTFGDLVRVQHDVPKWGTAGDVIGITDLTPNGMSVRLSEPVPFDPMQENVIYFRRQDGSPTQRFVIQAISSDSRTITLANATYDNITSESVQITVDSVNETLYWGTSAERTQFIFGQTGKEDSILAVVKAIRPRGQNRVELELLNEDMRVHDD